MLRQTRDLQDLAIVATDGAIADVKTFCFDEEAWAIRYPVVDASPWLALRQPAGLAHGLDRTDAVMSDTGQCLWRGGIGHRTQAVPAPAS